MTKVECLEKIYEALGGEEKKSNVTLLFVAYLIKSQKSYQKQSAVVRLSNE